MQSQIRCQKCKRRLMDCLKLTGTLTVKCPHCNHLNELRFVVIADKQFVNGERLKAVG